MCLCVLGNLDEKVDERVLYEIMVQAGPLVDLHMPRDKETKRHKGYAFAEFTTEKSALYAVNLFSGLVFLHKKLLRFSVGFFFLSAVYSFSTGLKGCVCSFMSNPFCARSCGKKLRPCLMCAYLLEYLD